MGLKFNKVIFQAGVGHEKARPFSRIIFSRDLITRESKLLPELFCLIEIDNKSIRREDQSDALILLDKLELRIIERIEKSYNSINESRNLHSENIGEHLLELILKSLNSEIKYLFEEKNPLSVFSKSTNIIIGIIEPLFAKDENKYVYHFAYFNRVRNFLVYRQGDKYCLMDIVSNKNGAEADNSENKIFYNIISGELEAPSFIVIANLNLTDFIIPDKLKQMVISLDMHSAINEIKRLLNEIDANEEINFCGILLYLLRESEKIISKPENSIERLINTEKNTEKFLTPSLMPDFSQDFRTLLNFFRKNYKKYYLKFKHADWFLKKNLLQHDKTRPCKENMNEAARGKLEKEKLTRKSNCFLCDLFKKRLEFLNGYYLKIVHFSNRNLRKCATFFSKINALFQFILNLFFSQVSKLFQTLRCINFFRQLMIIVIILSVVLLWKGISWLDDKKFNEKQEQEKNLIADEIKEKINSLEASLIYGDNNKARSISGELKKLLSEMHDKESELYLNSVKLLDRCDKKINKITEIENLEKLNLGEGLASRLFLSNQNLIIIGHENNIYNYNLTEKNLSEWEVKNDLKKFTLFTQMKNGMEILGYRKDENKIYKIDALKKDISEIKKNFLSENIVDINYYAENVYALDAVNNKIYVHKSASGQNWLKEEADLKNSVGFTIDGSIFIFKNNGEILKFFKGRQEKFVLETIEPEISSLSRIYTNADFKYLYMLDASNKRILVFEKECPDAECKLLNQYISKSFNNLKDFAIDEKNKIIYILNQEQIYEIKLED